MCDCVGALGPRSLVSRVGGVLRDTGATFVVLHVLSVRCHAHVSTPKIRWTGGVCVGCVDARVRCVLTCVCSPEEPGGGGQARRPQHHLEERDRLPAEPHQRSADHNRAPFAQSPAHASVRARRHRTGGTCPPAQAWGERAGITPWGSPGPEPRCCPRTNVCFVSLI